MKSPEVCVLKTDGVNCDMEMAHAFADAGATPETLHVNQLHSTERRLDDFDVLALPGGFSYGDDIASGKVLAVELTSRLSDQIHGFVDKGKPVIGVCNGFQVLVRTGLLPNRTLGRQEATLAENQIGRFECRWIDLEVPQSASLFVSPGDFPEQPIPMQTAHGEGRFFADPDLVAEMKRDGQVAFRYVGRSGTDPGGYPANPSGSIDDIAGICDLSGLVLGMMPHPERSIASFHPHRARTELARTAARTIFTNIVNYAREM